MFIFNKLNFKNNYIAITDSDIKYRYSDLKIFSDNIKSFTQKRSLVFCVCENNIETLFGYCSFIKNKVVPLMVDKSINEKLLHNLIDIYNPKYIWISNSRIDLFNKFDIIFSYQNYILIDLNNKIRKVDNNLALLLTTSGSTGSPKLVRISYENLKSNAISISKYLKIDKNERPITTLPISYSFGISIINSHLINGATILLTSKSLMESRFWSFLKENECTSLSGVPFTFEMLKKLRFFKMNLPHVKTITQAGGKLNLELNLELAKFCNKNKKKLFIMYGQTEASPRISYLPHNLTLSKLGSIGIVIPGGELALIDDSGQIISKPDNEGELVYYGKNVSLGYANSFDDLLNGDENKGVLFTGDLAKRDNEGFYYITGRKKRFIKLFGNRINLDQVESLIKEISKDECACIGDDNCMVVYITNNSIINQVSDLLLYKLGIHNSVFSIKIINEIPKNLSGKIIYSKLDL